MLMLVRVIQSRVEVDVLLKGLGWAERRNLRIDTGVCFLKQKQ